MTQGSAELAKKCNYFSDAMFLIKNNSYDEILYVILLKHEIGDCKLNFNPWSTNKRMLNKMFCTLHFVIFTIDQKTIIKCVMMRQQVFLNITLYVYLIIKEMSTIAFSLSEQENKLPKLSFSYVFIQ